MCFENFGQLLSAIGGGVKDYGGTALAAAGTGMGIAEQIANARTKEKIQGVAANPYAAAESLYKKETDAEKAAAERAINSNLASRGIQDSGYATMLQAQSAAERESARRTAADQAALAGTNTTLQGLQSTMGTSGTGISSLPNYLALQALLNAGKKSDPSTTSQAYFPEIAEGNKWNYDSTIFPTTQETPDFSSF